MKTQSNRATSIGDKMKQMVKQMVKQMESCPVIKDYYLVIGGGKIGTDFLQYARKNKFPFVLVIDRDENAPASREVKVLKTEEELVNLLKNRASSAFPEEKSNESEAYFYKTDMSGISSLFIFGIPEYIIPAVPCHAVAYMLTYFLKLPVQKSIVNESLEDGSSVRKRSPVCELFIGPEDSKLRTFFENIAATFPEDIIAGRYSEQGMLFFSYAKDGEICPDGCPGPRDRCPTFVRKKPETITEYVKKLSDKLPGWVFESHQMKPGIGGLKGEEVKQNLLEIMEFVKRFQEDSSGDRAEDKSRNTAEDDSGNKAKDKSEYRTENNSRTITEDNSKNRAEKVKERAFFVATTCTCHGVLNLFYVI